MVVDIFLRVIVRALSDKSEMWNFHPESDEEPLKVFEKEGRKDRSHGGLSAALREASGSKKTPTESLEPGVMSAVGCQEWERRGAHVTHCEMNRLVTTSERRGKKVGRC